MPCSAFCAFGLWVEADFPLPAVPGEVPAEARSVTLDASVRVEVERCWSGPGPRNWETVLDSGVDLRYELGVDGDHLIVHGPDRFHINAEADRVLCAPADWADFAWQRQLLDTALFTVSFLRGFELLHASAVALPRGAVAFLGPAGVGKTSLTAELVRRGHRLVCDDVLAIAPEAGAIRAFPAPAVMNLPIDEVRPEALDGQVLTRFPAQEEDWVLVSRAMTAPLPLAGLLALDVRDPVTGLDPMRDATLLSLAPYTISLPHDRGREARRFDIISQVVEAVGVQRLRRGSASASELADLVESAHG